MPTPFPGAKPSFSVSCGRKLRRRPVLFLFCVLLFFSHPSTEAGGLTWFGGTLPRNNEGVGDPLIYCHQLAGAGTRRPEGPEDDQLFPIPNKQI